MVKHLSYLFVFFLLNSAYAQKLSEKQSTIVRQTIEKQFGAEAAKCDLNIGLGNFCVLSNDTFFSPQGYNYLFKLQNDSLLRLDHSLFHGNNGRRFLFSFNGKIYALGGYGFFTTHNNLTYFNFSSSEWCYEPVKGSAPPFILGLTFKSGENIISFNNIKSGNNAESDLEDHFAYRLNLKTFTWDKFEPIKNIPFLKGESYYANNYVLFLAKNNSLLVSPEKNEIISLNNDKYGISPNAYVTGVENNKIVLTSRNNNGKIININLSLADVWKSNEKSATAINLVPYENSSILKWILLSSLLVILLIIYQIFRKRKIKNTAQSGETNFEQSNQTSGNLIEESPIWDELIKTLSQSPKSVLSTEELDQLLNISHLEPDSRKLKRHRIISEIQKQNPTLITRIKDSTDRRKFQYRIENIQNNTLVNE